MSYKGEADEMLYKQDREDKRREDLERRMGGPDAPEPCETCGGKGHSWHIGTHERSCYCGHECPRCLGSGVQP